MPSVFSPKSSASLAGNAQVDSSVGTSPGRTITNNVTIQHHDNGPNKSLTTSSKIFGVDLGQKLVNNSNNSNERVIDSYKILNPF